MRYKTPLQSIKQHCLECSGGSYKERAQCKMKNCPLFPFRLGRNPRRQKSKISKLPKKSKNKRHSTIKIKKI